MWFNALHSALAALTLKALRLASALPDPPQLQHIGWLARRHCLQVSDHARFVHASLENRERKSTKIDPRCRRGSRVRTRCISNFIFLIFLLSNRDDSRERNLLLGYLLYAYELRLSFFL